MPDARPDYTLKLSLILRHFDCAARDVTARLGIEPSRAWDIGDILRAGTPPRPFNCWIYDSPQAPENSSVEQQLAAMKTAMPDLSTHLPLIPGTPEVMMSCVVYAYHCWPGVQVTHADAAYLSGLKALFDLDLYDQIGTEGDIRDGDA